MSSHVFQYNGYWFAMKVVNGDLSGMPMIITELDDSIVLSLIRDTSFSFWGEEGQRYEFEIVKLPDNRSYVEQVHHGIRGDVVLRFSIYLLVNPILVESILEKDYDGFHVNFRVKRLEGKLYVYNPTVTINKIMWVEGIV